VATLLEEASQRFPFSREVYERQAVVHLRRKDVAGYRTVCAEASKRCPDDDNVLGAQSMWKAWLCTMGPAGVANWDDLVAWSERAEKQLPDLEKSSASEDLKSIIRYLALSARTAVLYRAGQHSEALGRLKALAAAGEKRGEGLHLPLIALVNAQLGHTTEARAWLRKSRAWLDNPNNRGANPLQIAPWAYRLSVKLLHEEAEQLLAGKVEQE
jgi:hypothetical protein